MLMSINDLPVIPDNYNGIDRVEFYMGELCLLFNGYHLFTYWLILFHVQIINKHLRRILNKRTI